MPRRPASETSVSLPALERRLVALQRKTIQGNRAAAERNALLDELSRSGYTQFRLAALLNAANAAEQEQPITSDAVFKAVRRHRVKVSARQA